jgi:hypothetical protein
MGIGWDEKRLIYQQPSNASFTSELFESRQFASGWIEFAIPNASDVVCTMRVIGGNLPSSEIAHDDLALDLTQVFVNGIVWASHGVTGLTHGGASAPGTFSIAADLSANIRVRCPILNVPRFSGLIYTRSSGGSAAAFVEGVAYAHLGS